MSKLKYIIATIDEGKEEMIILWQSGDEILLPRDKAKELIKLLQQASNL